MTRVLPVVRIGLSDGYGRPRAGVKIPGMHRPGSLTERMRMAASIANGTLTPSVKEIEVGRMAALLAGTVVCRA